MHAGMGYSALQVYNRVGLSASVPWSLYGSLLVLNVSFVCANHLRCQFSDLCSPFAILYLILMRLLSSGLGRRCSSRSTAWVWL